MKSILIFALLFIFFQANAQVSSPKNPPAGNAELKIVKTDIDLGLEYIDQVKNLRLEKLTAEKDRDNINYKYYEIAIKLKNATLYNKQLTAQINQTKDSIKILESINVKNKNNIDKLKEKQVALEQDQLSLNNELDVFKIKVADLSKTSENFDKINRSLLKKERSDRTFNLKHNKMYFDQTDPFVGDQKINFPKNVQFDLFYYPVSGELFDGKDAPDEITATVKLRKFNGRGKYMIVGTWEILLLRKIIDGTFFYENRKKEIFNSKETIASQSSSARYIYTIEINNEEILTSDEFYLY